MSNKIWQKVLGPEEKVEFEFSLSKRYLGFLKAQYFSISVLLFLLGILFFKISHLLTFILGCVLFLGGFGFFLFGIIYPWYLEKSNNFAFTTKRILILKGFLSTNLTSIDYDKITNIQVEQNFWEKVLFNSGTLIVDTAGTSVPEVIISKIENPYKIKAKLDEIRDKLTSNI